MPIDVCVPQSKSPRVVAQVNDDKLLFVFQNAGPTANHLVVQGEGFCGPVEDDGLDRGFIEPGGQNRHRRQHGIGGGVKPLEDVGALFFAVGVVEVHARIALFREHGLHLL